MVHTGTVIVHLYERLSIMGSIARTHNTSSEKIVKMDKELPGDNAFWHLGPG